MNFNRLIPGTIKSIASDDDIILRSDGTNIREYFYVSDAVDAYLALAENMERKEILGHAFNFSSGEKMAVLDVVEAILKLMKSDKKPKIMNTAKNEIRLQILSTEKAKKMLGWLPKYTFTGALVETIRWYEKFFELEKTGAGRA
jgi:CDP-glucose 4,6-dehydratase